MLSSHHRAVALAVLIAGCSRAPRPPAGGRSPLTVGEVLTLQSATLREQRVINVYLPPDYQAATSARYPVLYLLDGGATEDFLHVVGSVDVSIRNEVIRPVIVVGIANRDRRRDLVGPTNVADELAIAPHAGGANNFRAFLRDELKPTIARHYRTSDESALIGESFAGLFVIETLATTPELFDHYLAISPSVWWNEGATVRALANRLAWWSLADKSLYVASASDDISEPIDDMVRLLAIYAPRGLRWRHHALVTEQHRTIFAIAAVGALRATFGRDD